MAEYIPTSLYQQRSSGSYEVARETSSSAPRQPNEYTIQENRVSGMSSISIGTVQPAQFILTPAMPEAQYAGLSSSAGSSFKAAQPSAPPGPKAGEEVDITNGGSRRKRFSPTEKVRILKHLSETSNLRATARKFGVDRKTIRSWLEHREELKRMEEQGKGDVVVEQSTVTVGREGRPPEQGMTPPSKRRRNLTPGEKLEIVAKTELGSTVRQVAKDYGVDPKSVRYWQRQKVDLQDQMRGSSPRTAHVSAVPFQYQQNLGVWLQVEESRGGNVTYAMIVDKLRDMTKGSVYESFNPTDSWLMKFKKKYSIKSGEGGQPGGEKNNRSSDQEDCLPPAQPRPLSNSAHSSPHLAASVGGGGSHGDQPTQWLPTNQIHSSQLSTVLVFNSLRELMNSTAEFGKVAMCEGNSKLFVSTQEGWLRAELSPSCLPSRGQCMSIDSSSISVELYKKIDSKNSTEKPKQGYSQ